MHKNKSPRIYLDNQMYFITVKTFNNRPVFQDKILAAIFCQALKFLENRGDFVMSAGVLLPDHFHLLLKPVKKNISENMHDLKSYSAQKVNEYYRRGILAPPAINKSGGRVIGEAGSLTCEGGFDLPPVWQRSFYYHLVLSENDFENHFNYIIYNPEKHGYVTKSEDWPYLWYDFEKVDL